MTYEIKDMNDWDNVNADLVITDPPFGIEFSEKKSNYARNEEFVVSGYKEWHIDEYEKNFRILLDTIYCNLKENGQALIFSGWQSSSIISKMILHESLFDIQGKLYWAYNFAPACKNRPNHNVYEIFWLTKGKEWTYNKRCMTSHCHYGEANLSTLKFPKEYTKEETKYPTKLPLFLLKCLIEHFSNKGDVIFDPLAGSGMLGIVASLLKRVPILGDINPEAKKVYEHLIKKYRVITLEEGEFL